MQRQSEGCFISDSFIFLSQESIPHYNRFPPRCHRVRKAKENLRLTPP